ncbi:MAG: 4Fe-4S dicluster domain-containing protein [Gemmatimonadales bacterium]|nr:4Fe-4S dicluster domain-containing protein [Gemmatimonadales bacterium]
MSFLLTGLALALFLFFLWMYSALVQEAERVAARRTLLLALILPIPYLFLAWLPFPGQTIAGLILAGFTVLFPLVLVIPSGRSADFPDFDPRPGVDERTVMFSRAELAPGSERFNDYYRFHPEHRSGDDHFRSLAGLMSPLSGKFEPLAFAAAGAGFAAVEELAALVEREPAVGQAQIDPMAATRFFKGWTVKLGAEDCGVTELRDYHKYSVKGRGDRYGEEIELNHRFALALTVEMDHRNLGQAPNGPTLMESAQQYLSAGAVAVQVADCIRRLGWSAEAHIDANYKVICPLVARDAGLGEIGRMGLLMTPRLGPRVRIAVVTTDMPLLVDCRIPDPALLHFCSICRKCADVCPPGAIPHGPQEAIDGVPRWRIDDQACFTYWCAAGTDCGQCMRVCPYSHPDSALHNLVRAGLGHSALFRHFALWMDDFLFGRSPERLPRVHWLPGRMNRSSR